MLVPGSVRDRVARLMRDTAPGHAFTFPHITVDPSRLQEANPVLQGIITDAMKVLQREREEKRKATDAADVFSHWLGSVPTSLLQNEAAVVNYLCMLVAIDFKHWAQVPRADTAAGDVVEGLTGFYARVDHHEDSVEQQLLEAKQAAAPTLVRGSAAMMFLLKRAVEDHHIHWYDVDYLSQFLSPPSDAPATQLCFTGVEEPLHFSPSTPSLEAVQKALAPCFLGCGENGQTPLWMPATEARIQLLLSLAASLQAKQTSFCDVLGACEGKLFTTPGAPAATAKPFIPALVDLHYRYRDLSAPPPSGKGDGLPCKPAVPFPILKLSQLTALSLQEALPVLWAKQRAAASAQLSHAWLDGRRQQARLGSGGGGGACAVFDEMERLSICCDYQIPKLLRAAGVLQYDEALSRLVDTRRLLAPRSTEEVSIRVATLVGAEVLAAKIAAAYNALPAGDGEAHTISVDKAYTALDHILWMAGRSLKGCEHHLCHTIMY